MTDASLFQLEIGLETGAQAEEDARGPRTAKTGSATEGELFARDRDDHFIRRDGEVFAGTHLVIEVVNGHGLDDPARIEQAFRDCVAAYGATLLHIHTHKFSPRGVSGIAVLAESHINVHTWPEIGYGAFDVFMCGDADPWRAVDVLKAAFALPPWVGAAPVPVSCVQGTGRRAAPSSRPECSGSISRPDAPPA